MVRRAIEACVLGLSALALLLGLGFLHLQLPAGRRAARSLVETAAHDQIAGELKIGAIDAVRLDHIVVRNVTLRDPEGRVVLSVARAQGRIDTAGLLEREIRVVDLAIRRPRAHLYPSLDGTPSLVRALAPRAVRSSGPAPFLVSLDDAFLRDGRVDGVVLGANVDVRRLDARASLLLDGVAPKIDIAWMRAHAYAPLPADAVLAGRVVLPSLVDVRGHLTGAQGAAWVRFGLDHGAFDVGVELPPTQVAAVRASIPEWPFEGPVAGWATARGTLPDLRVAASGTIGGAGVSVRGRLGLPPTAPPTYDVGVVLENVAPQALLPSLVPVPITSGVRGQLSGTGLDPTTLTARFRGELAPSRVAGFPIPGGPVAARMDAGVLYVESFAPTAPGLSGRISGSVGLDGTVSGEASVTADRLALVQGLERIGGSGHVETRFSIAPGQPLRLRGRGNARSLVWGPLRTTTLTTRYDVSLFGPAGGVRLDVEATGTGTVVSGVSLGEVTVSGAGDQLSIRTTGVATEGARSLSVDAIVHPLDDGTGARIELPRIDIGLRDRVFHGSVRNLTVTPRRISIDALALGRPEGGRLELAGWVEPNGGVALEGHATNVDISELSEIALATRAPVDGRGDIHVSLTGPSVRRPRIAVDARIERGRWEQFEDLGLTVSASHADERLEVDLELARGGRPKLAVGGTIPVDLWAAGGPSLQAQGTRDLELEVFDVSLAEALPLLMAEPPPLAGNVSGSLALGGTWETPSGQLTATVGEGAAFGIDDLGLVFTARYAPEGMEVEIALSRRGRRVVAAQGTAGLRVEEDRTKILPTVPDILAAPLQLRLAFGPFDERALPAGWNADPPISATIGGTGSLRGSLDQPVIGLEVSVAGARWAPLPWTDPLEGAITATLQRSGVDVRRASFVRRGQPFVEIAGRVDLDPRASTPRVTGMQGSARVHEVDLASFTPIQGRPVTGRASATLSFSGTLEDPDAVARVSIARLGIAGIDYRPSEISARVADGMLEIDAQLRQVFGGTLRAEANLPLSHQGGVALLPDESSTLRGQLAASTFRIDGLEAFLPEVAMIGGTMDANLALSGTRGRPGLRGSFAVREGSFELSVLGQRYEEISITGVVEPDRLVITELSTRDRAGSATVTGTASLVGLFPERFELSARGRSFPIVRDGVTLADVSGRVQVRGRASRTGLEATIEPQGLRVALPRRAARDLQVLEDHPDIDIRRRFEDPPGEGRPGTRGSGGEGRFQIVAVIDMGSSVWISRNDLSLAAEGRLTARFPWPGPLALQGSVQLRRGYITPFGNNFTIQHGEVTFTGEPGFNPLIDVTALYDHPQIPVTLSATGRFERPQLTFQAAGLTQEEVIAFLTLGRTDIRSITDSQAVSQASDQQAAQLLFGLSTSFAQGELREVAPEWLPSFSWDANRFRAGIQVSRDLYLEYNNVGATESGNVNEARAEWRISRRWSLDTFIGDRGAGGLDVLWSYSY